MDSRRKEKKSKHKCIFHSIDLIGTKYLIENERKNRKRKEKQLCLTFKAYIDQLP